MMKFSNLAKTLIIIGGLLFAANTGAQAQQAADADTGFDGYRAMAVTAGIIGGAMVAVVVTDGLIIPAYVWVTGAEAGGMAAGGGAAINMVGGTIQTMGKQSYQFVRGGLRLLGAVSGGFIADNWYTSE